MSPRAEGVAPAQPRRKGAYPEATETLDPTPLRPRREDPHAASGSTGPRPPTSHMAEEVEVGGRTGGRGPACQGWGAPAAARGPQVLSLSPAHVGIRGHSGRAGTARLVRGQSPDVRGALVTATPNLQARLREAESLAQGHTAATRPRRDWGAQTVRLQSPSC